MSDEGMALLRALAARPVAYNPDVARAVGSVKAAVFLCQLLYWTGKGKRLDGFIWKTQAEMEEETALSRTEQENARKRLIELGVLEEKLAGAPAKLHYRVSLSRFTELLENYYRLQETCNLDCGKPANWIAGNLQGTTESTTEITQENTNPPAADKEAQDDNGNGDSPAQGENEATGSQGQSPDRGSRGSTHLPTGSRDQRGSHRNPSHNSHATPTEPAYVDLDDEGWPQDRKHPIIAYIEAESRNLGVARRLTPNQQGRLAREVQQSKTYPPPTVLFTKDPDFRDWLYEQICWANRADERKQTGHMISAMRNYERPGNGWLEYKQATEEKRARRKAEEGHRTHQAQVQRDGASGSADESAGPDNPTLEEYFATVLGP